MLQADRIISKTSLEVEKARLVRESELLDTLTKESTWEELLEHVSHNLTPEPMTEEEIDASWANTAHARYKHLTTTTYNKRFDVMPYTLRVQWNEARALMEMVDFVKWKELEDVVLSKFSPGWCVSSKTWKTTFSGMTTRLKKSPNIENWWCFTDIEQFVGYNIKHDMSAEERAEIAKQWLSGDVPRTIGSAQDEASYYAFLESEVAKRVSLATGDVRIASDFKFLSLREFVTQIQTWSTTGSSRGVKIQLVKDDGTQFMSYAKKIAIPMTYTIDEIVSRVTKWTRNETLSVTKKVEPGDKNRCIISAPFEQQIRMAYVEYCIESAIKYAFPKVYFLNTTNGQYATQMRLTEFTDTNRERTTIKFPMDATAFDQYVSKGEIDMCFAFMKAVCFARCDKLHSDVISILEECHQAYFKTEVVIDKTINIGRVGHGVPSGIRWTSLFDSMVNDMRFQTCKAMLAAANVATVNTLYEKFQGDDMAIVLDSWENCIHILEWYQRHNIPIKPEKNFANLQYMEFLRKVYLQGRQLGYPLRMMPKWCFRNPDSNGAPDNPTYIRERVKTYFAICQRTGADVDFTRKIRKMVIQTLPKFVSYLDEWLSASAANGGMAMIQYSNVEKPTDVKGHKFVLRVIDDKRPKTLIQRPEKAVAASMQHTARLFNYKFDPTQTMKTVTQSLDSTGGFNRLFAHSREDYEFKYTRSFGRVNPVITKMRADWRPWSLAFEYRGLFAKDAVAELRNRRDRETILKITDPQVYRLTMQVALKARDSFFWAWVMDDLPHLSFLHSELNATQVSLICDHLVSNSFMRMLATLDQVSYTDYSNLIEYLYNYLCVNIDSILTINQHLYSMSD